MFLKLMKQDIRATARIMVPVYAAAILLAVFTRVLDLLPQDNAFMSVLAGLVGVLFSLAMSATVVASFVLMIWRFHKNYMTDEGYLMFTLPVSTAELIFSKLLVAIAWFACSALVVSIATLIVGSGGHISFVGFDSIPAEELRSISAAVVTATLVAGVTFCLMLQTTGSILTWLSMLESATGVITMQILRTVLVVMIRPLLVTRLTSSTIRLV